MINCCILVQHSGSFEINEQQITTRSRSQILIFFATGILNKTVDLLFTVVRPSQTSFNLLLENGKSSVLVFQDACSLTRDLTITHTGESFKVTNGLNFCR